MNFLSQLTSQLGAVFRSQPAARRFMLLGVVLGSVALMVMLILRAQTGGYAVLYTGIDPSDANEALSRLRAMNIPVRVEDGGGTVKVPQSRLDEASFQLAIEGIPSSGVMGMEGLDKPTLGQSKFHQEKNYLRMREGELSRTLMSLKEVDRARVHLAIPDPSPFIQDEQDPTASVVVKLRRGSELNDRQISGIVHLVSRGIEGLKPEHVSIIDHLGNLINQSREQESGAFSSGQIAFKRQYEETLKHDIESLLTNIVGRGRVAARVQAEFNFQTNHAVREIYNPDDQDPIIRTEKNQSELIGPELALGEKGAPGSPSNLPLPFADGSGKGEGIAAGAGGSQRNDQTRDYAISRLWQETEQTAPMPTRLSVAILVDGRYEEIEGGEGEIVQEYVPRTTEEISMIEDLVKSTIGYTTNETRQDLVEVRCAPFTLETLPEEETGLLNYQNRKLIEQGIRWLVVGLIGLLLITMVLRPAIKGIIVAQAAPPEALPGGKTPASGQLAAGGEAPDLSNIDPSQLDENTLSQLGLSADNLTQMSDTELQQRMAEATQKMAAADSGQLNEINRLASQVNVNQSQANQVHQQVLTMAKSNPQNTVSLLRQWMEEGA